MPQKTKLILGAAGFILLLALAVFGYNTLREGVDLVNDIESPSGPDDNTPGPDKEEALDFTMEDWNGNAVKLSDLIADGKPIILNFWASWCPPCKEEMPAFERVYTELGGDVRFVMLNLTDGMRETREDGAAYVTEQGYTFPVFFDAGREGSSVYGIRSIPTTLFIDGDGFIAAGVQGAIDEATLRRGIDMIYSRNA